MAEGKSKKSLLRSRGFQILVVAVVAVVVAIVYMASRGTAPTYFTSTVKTGNITSVVQATGVVNPPNTISIGAQISGKITHLYVDFNSKVKKGQLLAQIDPTVYQNALDSANADEANAMASVTSAQAQVGVQTANVATARANVAKAQANLTMAALQKDRTVGLFNQGIDSAQQRDTDMATWQSDEADLASAEAGLQQAQASLKAAQASVAQAQAVVTEKKAAVQTAQTNLNYCNIYAPADGTIIDRAVSEGQTVASSLQTPTLFSESTDLTKLWVYMQTDESDEGRLKIGDDATFTVDAYPNTTYHGTVLQLRKFATTVQNVVEYDTIIAFDNVDEKVFPGMTAYVNVPVASARNVLEVPNSALRFKPNLTPVQLRALLTQYGMQNTPEAGGTGAGATGARAGGGGRRGGGGGGGRGGNGGANGAASTDANRPTTVLIWTLDANKNLVPVRVRTGITDFTYTAITRVLQGSLKAGDEVITGALVKNNTAGLPGAAGAGAMRGR